MNRACVWLTNLATAMLEPDERDAIRGDFVELGISAPRAVLESLGLIARRQMELWNTGRPWLAVLGIVAPMSVLLSGPWLRWLFQQMESFRTQGVRVENALPLADDIVKLLCGGLLVSTWAWIGGFTLASISRRTAWLPALLCLLYLSRGVLAALFYRQLQWVPPLLIPETVLFLLPSIWGFRRGARATSFPLAQALWWVAILAVMTVALQVESGREQLAFIAWSKGSSLGGELAWQAKPLPFALILWQLGFLFVASRSLFHQESNS